MKIAVIGGGAAGMMAACSAKIENPENEVFLIEQNDKLGKKVFITGKGRGNVTNAISMDEFFNFIPRNPKFLYSAFDAFTNRDLMKFLEKWGCRLKVERGDRVFPVSDHAYSITDALKKCLKKSGVNIRYKEKVLDISLKDGKVSEIITSKTKMAIDRVIIATGGLSYPLTGSTGDGYIFAENLGHKITERYPSLTSLLLEDPDVIYLKGLSLRNVKLTIKDDKGKSYYDEFGEMVFTDKGISGPLVLSASSYITEFLNSENPKKRKFLNAHIDLKPALSREQLDKRLLRDFEEGMNKELKNSFSKLLPAKLIPVFLERLKKQGLDPEKRVNVVSKKDRNKILDLLKDFSFTIGGSGGYREAVITRGGVNVREIDPKTMESKKIRGLYFAGELIDIDALTGGFNLQIAFSTAYLAGRESSKLD